LARGDPVKRREMHTGPTPSSDACPEVTPVQIRTATL
jgi:hypothetical protein